MKTKNIFKALALAMLMPAMVLTTACSNDDDLVNNENTATKGYALPVTINVSRQGDEGTTRASYNESTRMLSFSAGDKLFVTGNHYDAGKFAGTLDYDAVSGKFSGTVTTQKEYTGTIDDLMASAYAVLLPAGYESYGFNSIVGNGYEATIRHYINKAFALTKAAAVEQFSVERALSYSSGFALAPMTAIASFTISGLTANKKIDVSFVTKNLDDISGNVTTSATGVATFAVCVSPGNKLEDCTLTVDGNNIAMPTKTTVAGHIYNISRNVKEVIWNSSKVAGIDIVSGDPEYNSFESDGITVAAFAENGSYFMGSEMSVDNGYFTFTSSRGNIKKIEINYTGDLYWDEPSDGWSLVDGTFTWSGTPATSVTLSSSGYAGIVDITSIVFTLE